MNIFGAPSILIVSEKKQHVVLCVCCLGVASCRRPLRQCLLFGCCILSPAPAPMFVVWVLPLVAGPYANVCCLGVASCRQPLRQCLMHIRTCTCAHAGTCMHTHIHRCNSVPILLQLCRHQRFPSISVFHSSWLRSRVHPQATATST